MVLQSDRLSWHVGSPFTNQASWYLASVSARCPFLRKTICLVEATSGVLAWLTCSRYSINTDSLGNFISFLRDLIPGSREPGNTGETPPTQPGPGRGSDLLKDIWWQIIPFCSPLYLASYWIALAAQKQPINNCRKNTPQTSGLLPCALSHTCLPHLFHSPGPLS